MNSRKHNTLPASNEYIPVAPQVLQFFSLEYKRPLLAYKGVTIWVTFGTSLIVKLMQSNETQVFEQLQKKFLSALTIVGVGHRPSPHMLSRTDGRYATWPAVPPGTWMYRSADCPGISAINCL